MYRKGFFYVLYRYIREKHMDVNEMIHITIGIILSL